MSIYYRKAYRRCIYTAGDSSTGDMNDLDLHADKMACAIEVQRRSFESSLLFDLIMPCISLLRLSGTEEPH